MAADLDDWCPFKDRSSFVNDFASLIIFDGICLFNHRNRLPSKGTLIDQSTSFQNNTFKRKLNGILDKNNISRYKFNRRDKLNLPISECMNKYFIVGHLRNLFIEGQQLINCDDDSNKAGTEDDSSIDIVFLVDPERSAEEQKHVKRTKDLLYQQLIPGHLLYLHRTFSIRLS